MNISLLFICCISQLWSEHGKEEAVKEAEDRQDCQGLRLHCHPDLHGCPLCFLHLQLAFSCFTFGLSRTVGGFTIIFPDFL